MMSSGYGVCVVSTAVILLFLGTGCSAQCSFLNRPKTLEARPFTDGYFMSPVNASTGNYPSYTSCAWQIHSSFARVVKLHVRSFSLEWDVRCRYDNVVIHDGVNSYSPIIKKLCGHSGRYLTFYSTGKFMYITFRSDGSDQYRGFNMTYKSVLKGSMPTTTSSWHRPIWTFPTRPTTTEAYDSNGSYWRYRVNTAALIGGIAGGLLFICFLVVICRYLYNRSAAPTPPGVARPFTSPTAGPAYNNQPVFMTSHGSIGPSPAAGGNVNMAYMSYTEGPPRYDSLQMNSPPSPSAPPSYSEAVIMLQVGDTPKPE